MHTFLWFCVYALVGAASGRFTRYHGHLTDSGHYKANKSKPEFEQDPPYLFGQWIHGLVKTDSTGQLQQIFKNGSVPHNASFEDILNAINIPQSFDRNESILPPHVPQPWPPEEAKEVFKHLDYPVDPRCTMDHSKW